MADARTITRYPDSTERDRTEFIRAAQRRLGVKDDGDWGPKTAAAFDAAVPPPTVRTGSRELAAAVVDEPDTLQDRALAWCLREAESWGDRQVSDARVGDYLEGCVRIGKPIGEWLDDDPHRWPFCAAAQGCAESAVAKPGEALAPWRAGALELRIDSVAGRRPGERWVSLGEVMNGRIPRPGDLAVYENTQKSGAGHVERVIEADARGFRSIGANENNRRWVQDRSMIRYAATVGDGVQRLKLLGFSMRIGP